MNPSFIMSGDGESGEYTRTPPIRMDRWDQFLRSEIINAVASLAFDNEQELLWVGNCAGHVTSYTHTKDILSRYTSFQAHKSEVGPVRKLLTYSGGVLSLAGSELRCTIRRGIPSFTFRDAILENVSVLHRLITDGDILLGTNKNENALSLAPDKLAILSLANNQPTFLREVDCESGIIAARQQQTYICTSNTAGNIDLRDPNSFDIQHTIGMPHAGGLLDFDVHQNTLVTCGLQDQMTPDLFVNMFDLRAGFKKYSPVHLPMGFHPSFVRFVPIYSNRFVLISQAGGYQFMEEAAPVSPIHQCCDFDSTITCVDTSSSHQYIAMGDSSAFIHLYYRSQSNPFMNVDSKPIEVEDPIEPYPEVNMFNAEALKMAFCASVPMKYPSKESGIRLSSEWPEHLLVPTYRQLKPVPPDIMKRMVNNGKIWHCTVSGIRRNIVPYNLDEKEDKKDIVPDSSLSRLDDPSIEVPKNYRRADIIVPKYGVENFKFSHYNKSVFAGLEAHIANAYSNSMLQMLYFIEPLRAALLSHLCSHEFCLSCEMGFLFHMMNLRKGQTCQATNFLRAFRNAREVSALGLVLSDDNRPVPKQSTFDKLIQSWNRFILQQIHTDLTGGISSKSPLNSSRSTSSSPSKETVSNSSVQHVSSDESNQSATAELTLKIPDPSTTPPKTTEIPVNETTVNSKSIDSMLMIRSSVNLQCLKCSSSSTKENVTFAVKLLYPFYHSDDRYRRSSLAHMNAGNSPTNSGSADSSSSVITAGGTDASSLAKETPHEVGYDPKSPTYQSFSSVLQSSVTSRTSLQTYCQTCTGFQPHSQRSRLINAPHIFSINCHCETDQEKTFWKVQQNLAPFSVTSYVHEKYAKPCRYGSACTRKPGTCRYRHSPEIVGKNGKVKKQIEGCWIPPSFYLRCNENGDYSFEDCFEVDSDRSSSRSSSPHGSDEKDSSVVSPDEESLSPSDDKTDDQDQVEANQGITTTSSNAIRYDCHGVISYVVHHEVGKHLTAVIRVGPSYHHDKGSKWDYHWYLFNDFIIQPVEAHEAFHFPINWKIPCVLYYIRSDLNDLHDCTIHNPILTDVLFRHQTVVTPKKNLTFIPLTINEVPKKGDTVAMDAEFVTLSQGIAELHSDGTKTTIKPSQMAVARITVLRGSGETDGIPFIDDYISTKEQVADYLTEFSGIQPGDLDKNLSRRHLTTLKSTYVKLRCLSDLGVIFVGHGLKKDFRVINIVIPADQIIDTVELFHQPKQRWISLKFLIWYFFRIKIQQQQQGESSRGHDSIEDAIAALKLFRHYEKLKKEGGVERLEAEIQNLYEEGRRKDWLVPGGLR